MKMSYAIATPELPVTGGGARGGRPALALLDLDWTGFALDFTSNTYAIRTSSGAETLLGATPSAVTDGTALDFTDNTYAIGG